MKIKLKMTIALTLFVFATLIGQNTDKKPGVFIDCQMRCDFSFIKEEITFVNYMFDRQEADIYVLATRRKTGAGGREVLLAFTGNNEFSGIIDTIEYYTDPNATDAIEREQLVKELKKGLLQFLIQTPMIDKINYSIKKTERSESQDTSIKDSWNYWVFNIGGHASLSGEESYSSVDLSGRFNISRVTDQHKFRLSAYYNHEKSQFTLTDGEEFLNVSKSYNLYLEYVKSISPHWSVGFTSRTGSSTFGNTDITTSLKPALEYNIFPYSETSTRRFSFLYSIGPEYYNYSDTTVYDKLFETRLRHGLRVEFEQIQKWGSIEVDFGAQQYLHNPKLFNVFINPNLEWQIFSGLSIDLGGYFSFVSDRINIAKSDIADEDILLQIKQLDTDFTYFSYVGLNYRFGSKYNNFVNPRF